MADPVIALCMPMARGAHPSTMRCLLGLDIPRPYHFFDLVGFQVDVARNMVTEAACNVEDVTHILWIDDDMTFEPDAARRLLAHDLPIVGGLCFGRRHPYPPILIHETPRGFSFDYDYPKDQLVEVDATGAAFLLVKKEVFYKIHEQFKEGPWTPIGVGEDVSFPVAPSTPVLGADWRWRDISAYGPGDKVLGFSEHSPRNSSRRFEHATVEALIEKRLPRVRIVTDEEEIVTTLDHPWLAKLGKTYDDARKWMWLPACDLRAGMTLASVTPVVRNPDIESENYAIGYVQGLLHSDGTRYLNAYGRPNFSTRMKDAQPLERLSTMLARLGIESVRRAVPYWDGDVRHAPMHAVSVYRKDSAARLDHIYAKTGLPSRDFAAGYLAGMFDGDGSHDGGSLLIHSIVDHKKDRLERAARVIGVPFTTRTDRNLRLSGQENLLKFWQATTPALSRRTLPIGQVGNDGIRRGKEVKHRAVTVRAVENIGRGDVCCLTTTSSTFVAHGLASHNCRRARHVGYKVFVDTSVKIGHVGELVFEADSAKRNRAFEVNPWFPPRPIPEGEPVATIVIPTFNQKPERLRTAVESAATQTVPVEIIVVDNGSDRCVWCDAPRPFTAIDHPRLGACRPACCGAPAYPHLKLYRVEENAGSPWAALNLGIEKMTTEWFTWLSSDDLFYPHKIERQLRAMGETPALHDSAQRANYFASFHGYDLMLHDWGISQTVVVPLAWKTREEAAAHLAQSCYINGLTAMIHQKVFESVGRFDTTFVVSSDWELWNRIAQRFFWLPIEGQVLATRREYDNASQRYAQDPKMREVWIAEDVRIRAMYGEIKS